MKFNKARLERFRRTVWDFYGKNKRDLPWRRTHDPYRIFVSEVMLQQTQVSRVISKYKEFIVLFPDFAALAKAPASIVLQVWQGMGYNRRALYLKRAAETIDREHHGQLPRNAAALDALPGIGKATAASILVYSFNTPAVFIETNVRRVYIHHFFKDRENIDDREIEPLVEVTLDPLNPREWYWALMDYGTYLGRNIENPNRRSRNYAVQPRFEGSDRQIRGKILRLLLSGPMGEVDIVKESGAEAVRVKHILHDLATEGFIGVKGDSFVIV